MRAFVPRTSHLSRAMTRVENALVQYAPERVQVTGLPACADVVVLHVIGFPDTLAAVEAILERGQRYAMIQYCLRSTQRPTCEAWMPLWQGAQAVWSYYDLEALAIEDGLVLDDVNFYHSPLGADAEVFRTWAHARARRFAILTSGYVAETECAQEAALAAMRVGGETVHLGPGLTLRGAVTYEHGVSDQRLAEIYRQCQFVAGLRRVEGFELPAVEGLLCGARPVMFDRCHYRRWFEPFAEFIPELSAASVEDALAMLFAVGPRPVEREEIRAAQELFDWKRIAEGFWRHVA